ncbi:MAG TPA: OmpA family protein [Oligoflexus sp.]|uniref:OmpA family protein n=1 Tax=Oligoflexus sp. TaxID=1971216 RepID=UPI002D5A58B6|nr:OmpA family protein [Oligoflexus sp.]HYX39137.1 OmpA family protein [Oligoflexus sp.]
MTFGYVKMVAFCSVFFTTAALANIVGSDLQNFVPAPSSMDGVTVNNALTLGQGRFGLGLFVDYATNTLPYFKEDDGTTRDRDKEFNDAVTTLDLQAVYGLTNWWDVSVAAPFIIGQQEGDNDEPHGYYDRKGLTGYRVGTKLRVLELGPFALGVVGTAAYNRVQDNPYTQTKWPSMSLELTSTLNMGRWLLTANAGYRWRQGQPGDSIRETLPVERFGDQIIYSAGAVLPLGSEWAVMAEVYGARNWDEFSEESPRSTSIHESVLGLRYDVTPSIQMHLGAGAELQHSISSADARVYTGIRWTLGDKEVARPVAAVAPAVQKVSFEPIPKPDAVIDLDEVHFGLDSFEVRDPKAGPIMQRLTEIMRQHPDIERIMIEGHTCDLGSDLYNMKLSDRRAIAVEKWMVNRYGIDKKKLHSMGWGEWQPKVANADAASRKKNRRVSFKIYFQKNQPTDRIYQASIRK